MRLIFVLVTLTLFVACHASSVHHSNHLPSRTHRRHRSVAAASIDSQPQSYGDNGCTAWCACSSTCGAGTQSRQCADQPQESRSCSMGPCSEWNDWTQWTACSKTCGDGKKQRSRFCNTYYGCPGKPMESKKCNAASCDQLTPWSAWGKCSAFCDTGVRKRTRTCTVDGGCAGQDLEDEEECSKNPCCTSWSDYSSCSVSCGEGGVETRSQRCMIELAGAPMGYASEERKETRPCGDFVSPCASYGEWSPWGQCTVTCGGGERSRERTCSIQGACDGQGVAKETKRCHTELCPTWSTEWSSWTLCTVSCNGGKKQRSRQCAVANQCDGDQKEEADCNKFQCPEWTTWGRWSFCSEDCGGGWQKRGRVCNQYNLCPGDNFEKRICNEHLCPEWGVWSDYGECSAPCGGGQHDRSRPCLTDSTYCVGDKLDEGACQCDGESTSGKTCMTHDCATWGEWQGWGECTVQCGEDGTHTRRRECNSDSAFCVGDHKTHPSCVCEGVASQLTDCNSHQCPQWSSWGGWEECSATCGGGAKKRMRTCNVDEGYCTAQNENDATCECPGLDHSNDMCNNQLCSSFGSWGKWSQCSEPCGGGEKERKRKCRVDPDFCVGAVADSDPACQCADEDGEESKAVVACNDHACAYWGDWGVWTECSAQCDGGSKTRHRKCVVDAAHCHGAALTNDESCQCSAEEGDPDMASDCNMHTCPRWADWAEWGQCSVTCGEGKKDRKRRCAMDENYCKDERMQEDSCKCADGDDVEADNCSSGPCFTWASWEEWTACSVVCGGGSRDRARQCPEADACPGLGDETAFCNQTPCPDWGSWGGWSSCSVTCGGGQMVRTRACPLEGGCTPGEPFAAEVCSDTSCPVWAQWGSWGACSKTCGPGARERTRPCGGEGDCFGRGDEAEECFQATCTLTTLWSAWSPCTQTCGGGTKTRSRVESPTPGAKTVRENEPCNDHVCPSWATWEEWTACSKTCGGGSRQRERTCAQPSGEAVPNGCVGTKRESDPSPCAAQGCTFMFFF